MTGKPATLSSTLLVRKGHAAPTGFVPRLHVMNTNPLSPCASSLVADFKPPPHKTAGGSGGKGATRLTVRFEPEQLRRLKLASALTGQSMRDVLADALYDYLPRLAANLSSGVCHCLAEEKELSGDGVSEDKTERTNGASQPG
ncbi:MAG: hypothetical protein ACE5Q3_10330 [Alphaproteobacteria bacterium]